VCCARLVCNIYLYWLQPSKSRQKNPSLLRVSWDFFFCFVRRAAVLRSLWMTAAPPQSSGTTMKTPVITENAVALNHEILEALKGIQYRVCKE
jgi:hypothetical protein